LGECVVEKGADLGVLSLGGHGVFGAWILRLFAREGAAFRFPFVAAAIE
jgi:hypothetical protein